MPDPRTMLPLPHLSFAILLALADGARHGWSIIKRIEEASAGPVPSSGSLYLAMLKLEKKGLLREVAAPADVEREDQRRRYYALTEDGRRVLRAESLRLAQLVEVATSRDVFGAGGMRPVVDGGE